MPRLLLFLPLALAACSGPAIEGRLDPRAPVSDGSPAGIAQACREQAQTVLARQDRGQLMREDERDSRLGASTGADGLRSSIDRMGRQHRFDQMVRDCIRNAAPDGGPRGGSPRPS
ncbi:MAG: hypothetical protein K2X11_13685 [Acetobacteraceae bacterium]|nr:hypothetical protein [Acetobacteraceae bacterium]